MAGHFASIIDEFRQTAGRLALKHKDEKAKRKKKPDEEEAQEPASEEGNETPGDEEAEGEPEPQEEAQDPLTHVFRRATRHARVVAHPGHGQQRPAGPPEIRPTVQASAEKIGMPPVTARPPMPLKPRVVGPKR